MSKGDEFKVGNIVKLKSGGPDMTVKYYRAPGEVYVCQWFAGKKLDSGEFKPESLVMVDIAPKDA
ncbi:YodC family protein [Pseudomonas frederiksbergensis]|uniref:YodC family protein n=1 Tax=Pseudomonas frederiksbergensis TaxID=104087 RepID=UPI003D985C33